MEPQALRLSVADAADFVLGTQIQALCAEYPGPHPVELEVRSDGSVFELGTSVEANAELYAKLAALGIDVPSTTTKSPQAASSAPRGSATDTVSGSATNGAQAGGDANAPGQPSRSAKDKKRGSRYTPKKDASEKWPDHTKTASKALGKRIVKDRCYGRHDGKKNITGIAERTSGRRNAIFEVAQVIEELRRAEAVDIAEAEMTLRDSIERIRSAPNNEALTDDQIDHQINRGYAAAAGAYPEPAHSDDYDPSEFAPSGGYNDGEEWAADIMNWGWESGATGRLRFARAVVKRYVTPMGNLLPGGGFGYDLRAIEAGVCQSTCYAYTQELASIIHE
jgi:predicted secreted protein